MKTQNEYEKRCKVIQLFKEGYVFNKVLQLVQRSRGWLSNIISYGDEFYGLAQNEWAFDIRKAGANKYKKCFVGETIHQVKRLIGQLRL